MRIPQIMQESNNIRLQIFSHTSLTIFNIYYFCVRISETVYGRAAVLQKNDREHIKIKQINPFKNFGILAGFFF